MANPQLLRDFQKKQTRERLAEKPGESDRLNTFRKKFVEEGTVDELRAEVERLSKIVKGLERTVALRNPGQTLLKLPVQRQISIPVATDEGGLGTVTRPQPGQIPVGQVNGTYAPAFEGTGYSALSTKTANYTATDTDRIILVDATSGAITITLPTAVGRSGKIFTIKRLNAGANAVTVDGAGTETIDGDLTQILTLRYVSIDIVSDNANWSIL